VLGNHELNLLRGQRKEGNGWFHDEASDHDIARGKFETCSRLHDDDRQEVEAFLRSLPLALERDDLRVVHACWHEPAIEAARATASACIAKLYDEHESMLQRAMERSATAAQARAQEAQFLAHADNSQIEPGAFPDYARADEHYQNGNPVRALTSGLERVTQTPFYASGKWRLLERVRWWNEYDHETPVVFGHYWRTPDGMARPAHKGNHDVFEGRSHSDWLGPRRNAMCIDFCVGARHLERQRGASTYDSRLAAMRWPEAVLVTDDGALIHTQLSA
jgi:hypothetical protein